MLKVIQLDIPDISMWNAQRAPKTVFVENCAELVGRITGKHMMNDKIM